MKRKKKHRHREERQPSHGRNSIVHSTENGGCAGGRLWGGSVLAESGNAPAECGNDNSSCLLRMFAMGINFRVLHF